MLSSGENSLNKIFGTPQNTKAYTGKISDVISSIDEEFSSLYYKEIALGPEYTESCKCMHANCSDIRINIR